MAGQKGIAQILIVIILFVGLLGGLYLVQNIQVFKPKAYDPNLISAPIPPPICKSRLSSFSVEQPCDEVNNGFKSAKFSCQLEIEVSDLNSQGGEFRECRTIADWVRIADQACGKICEIPVPPLPVVCSRELPRCEGELIEVPGSEGCPNYICVQPVPQITPPPKPTSGCYPWAPFCQSLSTCLFITKECPEAVVTPEYITPIENIRTE